MKFDIKENKLTNNNILNIITFYYKEMDGN